MTDLPASDAVPAEVSVPVDGEVDHIIGVSFDKVTRAEEVLLALVHLQQEGEIAMSDAVVVLKDDDGKVRIQQTIDPTPGRSALTGSIWGMLVGMLFGGPVFLAAAAAGAGGGALMAKLIDLGLDDAWVKDVGHWLDPGTSALLILVAADVRPAVLAELGRYEGDVLYCTFPDAVRQELERALSDED
ncbi:DUF1269 domain-containing protein [Aquihabitans daechungensis]|uniref:DUF1269 domain-containing protein n=1 Tax=Aquihabitans daechungensis TaxID=1052257 RepID=UPI003BA2EF96